MSKKDDRYLPVHANGDLFFWIELEADRERFAHGEETRMSAERDDLGISRFMRRGHWSVCHRQRMDDLIRRRQARGMPTDLIESLK